MDTIQMTETMVNNFGKPKDTGYCSNLHPTVPIAELEVYGEIMKLRMDCFSECGNTGGFSFEIVSGTNSIASGSTEFLLDRTEIQKVQFDSFADGIEENAVDSFVRKCILLFDEFNYIEWQNEMYQAKGSGGKSGRAKTSGKRNYRIDPVLKAGRIQNPASEEELMEMLRNEAKSFSTEKKTSSGKHQENKLRGEDTDTEKHTARNTKSYIRRTNAWYVRGHYDRHGKYHRFRFVTSAIPVGGDYLNYRKPIQNGKQ